MNAADIDLSRWIRPGDTVVWGQGDAEPRTLVAALLAQRHRLKPLRALIGIGHSQLVLPAHADAIDFVSYCGTGSNRALADAGVLDILPGHYGQWADLMRSGPLRPDVVLLQVSPPDADGRHSFGLALDYLAAACEIARVVIAEVNDQVPWTHGERTLGAGDFAAQVRASYRCGSSDEPAASPGWVTGLIARHVAGLIDDGATLQLGLGALPDAVLAALHDRRDLGLHSGAATDGIVALAASGALTHARKSIDFGVGVAGTLLGGAALHRYAHRNPALQLRGLDYTHHPSVLARIDRLAAINSAVEVDLSGQVNAEVAAGRYVGAVGGAPAFLQGAHASRGGLPIVALPSSMRAGAATRSRIVAQLAGPVSTARCDAGIVVTEHGVADLRGRTLTQRLRLMLAIAAPEHRETLAREAHEGWRQAGIHRTRLLGH